MLAVSTSRMSEDYADLSGVVIDAEDPDDIIVTGEYVGSDGSASGYLNSADMTSLYRAYGADTHRRLTPQAATADLYTHQGGQRYALDVGRSSMAYSSIGDSVIRTPMPSAMRPSPRGRSPSDTTGRQAHSPLRRSRQAAVRGREEDEFMNPNRHPAGIGRREVRTRSIR